MVSIDKAIIARISRGSHSFEVLVDPNKTLDYKRGKPFSIENLVAVNQIFKDAKKGEKASEEELKDAFGTTDTYKIADEIIRKGDIQITTEQRRKLTEEKCLEIADTISKQGVDPKTHIPHPQNRILNAMNQMHIDIDPFKPARDQVKRVIEKIQEIIPIAFERVVIALRIPIDAAGKVNYALRDLGEIRREEWKSDAWYCEISVPAGMQSNLFDKVNSLTSGRSDVKILKHEEI